MRGKAVILVIVAFTIVVSAAILLQNPEDETGLKVFSSSDEFREFLSKYSGGVVTYPLYTLAVEKSISGEGVATPTPAPTPELSVERHSQTNVQVVGIDEPDIVKTDGKHIFVSKTSYHYIQPRIMPPVKGETVAIAAFPPQNMSVEWKIDRAGNMLLHENILLLLTRDELRAYNIAEPEEIWKVELNGSLIDARLYDGKVYIVTSNAINPVDPCPIRPLSVNGKVYEIGCSRIYHPTMPVSVDTTYSVVTIDLESGRVEDSASFVGSAGYTVVYMSKNGIYVTYNAYTDPAKLAYDFVKENTDLVPDWVVERIEKLMNYDISSRAKSVEISVIMEQLMASLGKDERLKFENEYWNRWTDFQKKHAREIEKTYIAKFSLNLEPEGVGEVPGRLLNQFSLDEFEGYLRVATTVGGDENDLYVLDDDLKVVGSIKGFGLEERIYAVRFVGEKGYIVTFRQTDPFFVLDLSDPEKPKIAGELKIPGFSSYLHPISENLVLGIGKEDEYVKVSLFDVSNPENPTEIDRYTLREFWSDVLNNHHAFLLDKEHEIFFLPAVNGGYVFSYSGGEIGLVKAVSINAQRAIYINDYLYIIGIDRITAYDENTWEQVGEIEI